jgi:hypothetical protein
LQESILDGLLASDQNRSFHSNRRSHLTPQNEPITRWGKIRYGLAALLLALPLPIVLIAFLMPGCGGDR